MTFGERVRGLRKPNGLTLRGLAGKLGVGLASLRMGSSLELSAKSSLPFSTRLMRVKGVEPSRSAAAGGPEGGEGRTG